LARGRWSQDLYVEAFKFAALAHLGQKVPGTEISYIAHPALVSVEIIAALEVEAGHDADFAIQCALLHDVVEDTSVTYERLKERFGVAVANGVLALSKDPALPKERQMADSVQRIRRQPTEVWMVKLADRITNLQQPPPHWTAERIAGYREEAIQIHRALGEASELLSARLLAKIEAYETYITPQRTGGAVSGQEEKT
jgi:(p)ppGpp synthase/HD superfamily hydrolase